MNQGPVCCCGSRERPCWRSFGCFICLCINKWFATAVLLATIFSWIFILSVSLPSFRGCAKGNCFVLDSMVVNDSCTCGSDCEPCYEAASNVSYTHGMDSFEGIIYSPAQNTFEEASTLIYVPNDSYPCNYCPHNSFDLGGDHKSVLLWRDEYNEEMQSFLVAIYILSGFSAGSIFLLASSCVWRIRGNIINIREGVDTGNRCTILW